MKLGDMNETQQNLEMGSGSLGRTVLLFAMFACLHMHRSARFVHRCADVMFKLDIGNIITGMSVFLGSAQKDLLVCCAGAAASRT